MANFCDKCGAPIESGDLFCNNCGAEIKTRSKTWVSPGKPLESSTIQASSQPSYRTDQPRKFYRSRKDRWIAGVCGGLGEYFGIDPILIRIAFIIAGLGYGAGLLVYILLAIFVSENPNHRPQSDYRASY